MKLISKPQIIQKNGNRTWFAVFYNTLDMDDISNCDMFLKYPSALSPNDKQFEPSEIFLNQPKESLAYEYEIMKPKVKEFVDNFLLSNNHQYAFYRVYFKDFKETRTEQNNLRSFTLSEEQEKKYDAWRKTLPKADYGATGGGYTFCFTPTGLGDIVKVTRDDGYELDLTEVDKW